MAWAIVKLLICHNYAAIFSSKSIKIFAREYPNPAQVEIAVKKNL